MTDSTLSDPLATAIPPSLIPDWVNRRKVIFVALWFCAAMSGLIIGTGCMIAVLGVFYSVQIEPSVLGLLGSALYTLAFVATSIIGSYVFGVNMDWANTRQHILDLVSTSPSPTANTPGTVTAGDETPVITKVASRLVRPKIMPPG